uniref:Cytochrome c oxidase subunit 8A, mitochondrial n=1 Tax=Strigops habroptila TaxID=2489341 RepID=A0A672TKZ6_STRHB
MGLLRPLERRPRSGGGPVTRVTAVTGRAAAVRGAASPCASAMPGLQRGSRLLATLLRPLRVPRAHITSKPPEHPLSEQVIAFSIMCGCFLLPTAWVLGNIENYKSRPE